MIKVTENGVPLAAIVSVEIREPQGTFHEPKLDPLWYAYGVRLSEAEARRARYEWLAQWPEVAAFWPRR